MQSQLFRKKSVERITSPEQLQDYMRVTNPGVWLVLGAVIALLAGLLVSSALVTLETTLPVRAVVASGSASATLPAEKAAEVKPGMTLRVGGLETPVDYVFQEGDDSVAVARAETLPDGAYEAQIVTETITPIKLLIR